MVSVRDMKDDHYQFEDHLHSLVKKVKTMYQLGDEVVVKVKTQIKKHLDFTLIGKS
jgi:exoribonuclease R